MAETPILDTIESPDDLRALPTEKLAPLCGEIRAVLTEVVSCTGGHLASNLGVVELTLALHRTFDFSSDHLVFDVGHQCYTHKLITGRYPAFSTLRQKNGITGFPNPRESDLDPFVTGHACTSISSALGLAIASRLRGNPRTAVAVIGDGSIGGGLAFEALNHAGHSKENILVVLNDNNMAIAKTVGALSGYLTRIRTEPAYQEVRDNLRQIIGKVPFIGNQLDWLHEAIIDGIKQVVEPGHVFSDLGFHYYGPIDGHDMPLLLHELENLKAIPGPKLLHINTTKGNGFAAASEDPESFHSASPFEILPGGKAGAKGAKKPSYTKAFAEGLLNACRKDERVVAITAAMPAGTGLSKIADEIPDRYIDVGISEEHAVTLARALAKGGIKPVVSIYSTFLQRAYDEIFHDLCLQPDLGVVLALDRAGLVGEDGPTHHGVFDIAMLRHLPNITLMAPKDGAELAAMLDFALTLDSPVALRYPRAELPEINTGKENEPVVMGKSELLRGGKDGVVFAYGEMVHLAQTAAEKAHEEGVDLAVVNLRFAKPLDEERILDLVRKLGTVITVEDGCVDGGVGSAILELLSDCEMLPEKMVRLGIPDRFIAHASRAELLEELELDTAGLCRTFVKTCRHGEG